MDGIRIWVVSSRRRADGWNGWVNEWMDGCIIWWIILIGSKKLRGPSRSNWCRPRANGCPARTGSASGRSSTSPRRWIATFRAKRPAWISAGETSYILSARTILTGNSSLPSNVSLNVFFNLSFESGGKLARKVTVRCALDWFRAGCSRRSASPTKGPTPPTIMATRSSVNLTLPFPPHPLRPSPHSFVKSQWHRLPEPQIN